jgi:putative DNA primase/helicase
MDIIGRWIEERCKLNAESWTDRTQLYNDYEPWSKQEAGFAKSRVTFYRELADRGFQQSKSNGVRGFQGLIVKAMPM